VFREFLQGRSPAQGSEIALEVGAPIVRVPLTAGSLHLALVERTGRRHLTCVDDAQALVHQIEENGAATTAITFLHHGEKELAMVTKEILFPY
jgi:hypothetical protein